MKRFTVKLLASGFLALLLASLNAPAAKAQTVTGTLLGTIRDSQGAVIPNATLSAKNPRTIPGKPVRLRWQLEYAWSAEKTARS